MWLKFGNLFLRGFFLISLSIFPLVFLYSQVPPVIQQDTTVQIDTSIQKHIPNKSRLTKSKTHTKTSAADSLKGFQEKLRALGDTTGLSSDTLLSEKEDWQLFNDSTARVSQWVHHRKDAPVVEMFPGTKYSLYLDIKSPAYKRELQIDSTGQYVTVREMVNGLDVKVPTTMTLEDYIHQRFEYEKANGWRSLTNQVTAKKGGDDLSGLLSSITNISIPVPANPLTNIFGGNEINLRISGGVDIRAAFRNTKSDQMTIARYEKSRNEPDFNQNVTINVNGTIGKKLNILADWNTQRTFEYENQLKIKYTGFEDEIIQSIEAGNVSLQTPSLVGGGSALFGIKSKLQTGPLTLTALLSQKKGQTKEITVSGGATSTKKEIYFNKYSTRHFFLDTVYIKFLDELKREVLPTITPEMSRYRIEQIDVWLSTTNNQAILEGKAKYAKAYIDLPSRPYNSEYSEELLNSLSTESDRYYQGNFVWLDPTKDYTFDQYGGYITMLTSVNDEQVIAVAYTVSGINDQRETYGESSEGTDTIHLKLIKPKFLFNKPNSKPAWDLLMKNFYSVEVSNLKKDGFELNIWRRTDGTPVDDINGVNLLTILGLDRYSINGESKPDNSFDFIPGITVDPKLGEIIFPTLRPFDSTIVRYFRSLGQEVADSLLFSEIYDTTQYAAQNSPSNKYYMEVKATGEQKQSYDLGFNLVEGSVQVLYNGHPLTPKVDYTVDYITGRVTILKPEALLPNANVQVKYEQNDLFSIASKTLIGARGEIDAFPDTKLGFTIMNLNKETLSDKVRINEEPTNNMMLGVDASTNMNLPFLTNAIDALPGLRTREMSTMRMTSEAAYMIPDPNTKKSTIAGDHGASIAYLDDFEGARRTIPFPVNYGAWTLASVPRYTLLNSKMKSEEKTYYRSQLVWYNRLPTDVVTEDIWPNRRTRPGQNQVTVLNLDYDPNHRGVYNYSPKVDSTLHRRNIGGNTGNFDDPNERRKNWNGVMRYIGSTAAGILEQNITYLEVWMKATSEDIEDLRRGRLYVDLGRINEDVIPNGKLNTEDFMGLPNGVLNEGEDVGIDQLNNQQEQATFSEFLASNAGDPDVESGDPSGDDYKPYGDGSNLRKFNGTEDNKLDYSGMLPSTEDISGDGSVELADEYLEYELPLDTVYYDSTGALLKNEYRVGGGKEGWYQFRIPLFETARSIGGSKPDEVLRAVQYIRLWVSGFSSPVNLRIAELDLVGNQWIERLHNDTIMKASVVNIEDNPEYNQDWYELGIQREKDRTDPNQIIEANEQSLALVLNGLPRDSSREVVKYFTARPMDIFNYKSMKMFVHGDPKFVPGKTEIYIRFGSDTMNYYEYRQPIYPGWNISLNEINIVFSQLTAIKSSRPDSLVKKLFIPPGEKYGIKGNPSLRQIREIAIGIKNNSEEVLYGQIWVNELRLVDVDNSPGLAFRFDTQIKLADFGQVSFNYSKTDPSFHGLEERFGSQTTKINWATNASFALDKFFPDEWQGTSIPIAYSHTEVLDKPKYLPNTDVVVVEAASRAATPDATKNIINQSQTLQVRDSYSISNFKIVTPIQAWYVRDTFSKLSLGFNYNTSKERNPSFVSRESWQWSARIGYGVTLPPSYFVQPFKKLFDGIFFLNDYKDWKFYYVPFTNLSANLSGQRSRSVEISRTKNSAIRDARNFNGSKSFGFGWKLTEGGITNISGDYGVSVDKNLLPLDNDTVGRDFLTIVKNLLVGGRDSRYGQKFTINTKPKLPNILDIPKYFDFSAGYSVNYGWQNSFQKGDLGKSAGFDNNISLSLTFRLKSLTDPWFAEKENVKDIQKPTEQKSAADKSKLQSTSDTTKQKSEVPSGPSSTEKLLSQLKLVGKYLIKYPLLDYENISISYSQNNRAGHGGVLGANGFQNFWGRLPFQGSRIEYGPSRLYQLGLINDPHGTLQFSPKSSFPFIGWKVNKGIRAANGQFTDQYSQGNNITLRTNRPLWTGASIDINWKVGWQYSRSTPVRIDSLGNPIYGEPVIAGSIERSFLTLPPVLLFKVLKSNLEDVGKKYDQLIKDNPEKVALAESFEKGMEALPFLNKIFGPYVPRPNWSIRWDGIEKVLGLTSVFDRLSFDHSYNSSFRRDYRSITGGGQRTDAEKVNYGFTPLAGLGMTFKQLFKGNLSGNFKFNSTTSYDLNMTSTKPNIVSTLSQEISLSLQYSRRGFSLPLFGLNLSNDVEMSFTYSITKNSRRQYFPDELSVNQEGQPQDGSTRTLMEPRLRYVLSSRVTAALYYRYTRTAPDAAGSRIFGNTTNEAGLDIHISI